MFRRGDKKKIRPMTTTVGLWVFPGYDFGGVFTALRILPINPGEYSSPEMGWALMSLHKGAQSAHIARDERGYSPAIRGLVLVSPILEGTYKDREAEIIIWVEPGNRWREAQAKIERRADRLLIDERHKRNLPQAL